MTQDYILQKGKDTFYSESETLRAAGDSLQAGFAEVVRRMDQIKGRIILTGIGKNQFIGKKIAATLNSIGRPSLFMHAGDAIHGDLGMVHPDDMVLCLSKSGNSPEIKVLIPLIRNSNTFLVGVSAEPDSYLAKNADLHIHIPIDRESCPHNLTPTNSTTAFLVLGDALAMCLLELNHFSPKDFARFHPGGSIGKKLYLKVSDLYQMNEKPIVSPETSIQETIIEISQKRLGTAVVCEGTRVVGIITDGDLRRMLQKHTSLSGLTARNAMSENPRMIQPDAFAIEALNIMRSNNITQLIVTKEDLYLGVIHIHDILREGIV